MREDETGAFVRLLGEVIAMYPNGKPLSDTQMAMYLRAVAEHPLPVIRAALDAHVRDPQRGRFQPLPADILAQIAQAGTNDGRPGPEEAWAIALAAQDEFDTVVWTAEMAAALQTAKPVFAIGDEIGARMAFREAYARLTGEARAQRQPVEWRVSLGFDAERRQAAIAAAVTAGRLPMSELQALPAPSGSMAMVLLPDNTQREHTQQKLRELADKLRGMANEIPISTEERDRLNAAKAGLAERVKTYEQDGDARTRFSEVA